MDPQWTRRTVLSLSIGGIAGLAGCTGLAGYAAPEPQGEPVTEFYGGRPIEYHHDRLRLSLSKKAVRVGDSLQFAVTNTSESNVALGCHNPWTIQTFREEEWKDVVWTSANGFPSCSTVLEGGETRTERVTVDRAALETGTETVKEELTAGRYRLVLLSTDPFLAADFHLDQ